MATSDNGETEPRRSLLDWVLEMVSLAVLFAIAASLVSHWASLPALVPLHFGLSGKPDRWGSKSGLLVLPLTAAGIYVLLSFASRYQRLINIPIAIDRSAPHVRALLLEMSIVLKAILLCLFLLLWWRSVQTAFGHTDGLGRWFLPLFLAAVFLPLGVYLLRLRGISK